MFVCRVQCAFSTHANHLNTETGSQQAKSKIKQKNQLLHRLHHWTILHSLLFKYTAARCSCVQDVVRVETEEKKKCINKLSESFVLCFTLNAFFVCVSVSVCILQRASVSNKFPPLNHVTCGNARRGVQYL